MINTIQKTCAIIKPDAVADGYSGLIIDNIERNGFVIVAMEKRIITKETAEKFYALHKSRHFFGELVDFITSGPVIVLILERADAIVRWRELMGATNPAASPVGTLRCMFGTDIARNALHGSDSVESAQTEISCLFNR